MGKQFDLEQQILACWNVTSDLDVLFEELVENTEGFDRDKVSNFVLGLTTIYGSKFEKLFRTFEEFLKEYYQTKKAKDALELQAAQQYVDELELADAPTEENDVAAVRKQYHEELAGLSDDEIVRTIREQYDSLDPLKVKITYKY